ncbi:MAG: hypothetical protein ACRCXA_09470 [Peptostreptococcaceae bacterium]
MKKNIIIGSLVALSLFTVGCKDSSTKPDVVDSGSEQNVSAIKISIKDSITNVKDKLYNACFFDKQDKAIKTLDESLEYIKEILPEGVEEIENINSEENGTTKLKYKIDDIVFYVIILHPNNGDSTFDMASVSGISFPRVEIDTNWQSE